MNQCYASSNKTNRYTASLVNIWGLFKFLLYFQSSVTTWKRNLGKDTCEHRISLFGFIVPKNEE
jgi:hypothetical protein